MLIMAFLFFRALFSLCKIVFFFSFHIARILVNGGEKGFGIIDIEAWSPTVPAGSCSWSDGCTYIVIRAIPLKGTKVVPSTNYDCLRLPCPYH